MNMCSVEDLFDQNQIHLLREDVYRECSCFGNIQGIEIPLPSGYDEGDGTLPITYAHGKIFVKFN